MGAGSQWGAGSQCTMFTSRVYLLETPLSQCEIQIIEDFTHITMTASHYTPLQTS